MTRLAALVALAATLATGCLSLAPDYQRPAAPIPTALAGGEGDARAADVPWQDFVREPKLRKVIELALANNRDLRKAALNIEAARAQYRIQRAAMLPSLDAVAAITSARVIIDDDNNTATSTQYSATVGLATWEIDVFGRLKNLSRSRQEQYFATVENAKAARISLIAEVAAAYLTLAADRSRLAIAVDTVESSKQTMELTDKLVAGGTSNRGDYYQAATVYEQARGDVALLTAASAQDKNALDLLCGGIVADDLMPEALPDQLDWFADVPVGMASAVLLERPDVQAAEHQLKSANADIGAARAQFFPSLSLTASGGLASLALGALFTGPAAIFTLAPAIGLPLFRGGANRANLAYTEVQKEIMIATYEQAIQAAFRDVADALATRATIEEQLSAQRALHEAATKSFELAQGRYQAGIDPFLSTLVQQRALYGAKNSLVNTQLAALGNRVTLYRVLGGGLK